MESNMEKLIKLEKRIKRFVIASITFSLLAVIARIYWIKEKTLNQSHMNIGIILTICFTSLAIFFFLFTYDIYKHHIDEEIENEKIRPEVIKRFRLNRKSYTKIICIDTTILNKEDLREAKLFNLDFYAKAYSDSEVEILVKLNNNGKIRNKFRRSYKYLDKHFEPIIRIDK